MPISSAGFARRWDRRCRSSSPSICMQTCRMPSSRPRTCSSATTRCPISTKASAAAPGGASYLLPALLEGKSRGAAAVIWEPGAAAEACRLGVGGRFKGKVGGKTMALHGPPVAIEGRISFAGPVSYKRDAAWMNGQKADLGPCAAIEMGGVKVIVTTERAIPFDTMHLRIPGAVPEATKTMTLKCAVAWSGAFGAMPHGQVYVATPGLSSSNPEPIPYTGLAHHLYPPPPNTSRRPH